MKKLLLFSLLCLSAQVAKPMYHEHHNHEQFRHGHDEAMRMNGGGRTFPPINGRNALILFGAAKALHSLYKTASEGLTLRKLKSQNKSINEINTSKERIKQHAKSIAKACGIVTAACTLNNRSLSNLLTLYTGYNIVNNLAS